MSRLRLINTLIVFMCFSGAGAFGQETDAGWQARPTVTAHIEVGPHSRLQVFGRLEDGLNYSYRRLRAGAAFGYRMKRILKPHRSGFDEEDEHNLVVGGGYEYLERAENDEASREHRVSFDATPRHLLPAGFLATDRNRLELRWVDGGYNARYRNKVTLNRPLEVRRIQFTPYGTGELFYDRNRHSWNRTQYGFGAQFGRKGLLVVDTYYLHENCTGCSRSPLNIWGLSLNFYFKKGQ